MTGSAAAGMMFVWCERSRLIRFLVSGLHGKCSVRSSLFGRWQRVGKGSLCLLTTHGHTHNLSPAADHDGGGHLTPLVLSPHSIYIIADRWPVTSERERKCQ